MTRKWTTVIAALVAQLLALLAPAFVVRADIFQWEYINPADPNQGKQPSLTLTPDGAGVNAAPGVNLANRNLTKAYLIGANFSDLSVGDPINGPTEFISTDLSGANLSQADLTGATIRAGFTITPWGDWIFGNGANLTGANLSQSTLANADLSGATFTGANLSGATVKGARLPAITLAQLYSTASYQAHDLTGIALRGSRALAGGNFADQNLSKSDFYDATLTNVDFSQANLTNAYLVAARLTGANLARAEVRGANFNVDSLYGGTGLTTAQLSSTASYLSHDLTGIQLAGSNLTAIPCRPEPYQCEPRRRHADQCKLHPSGSHDSESQRRKMSGANFIGILKGRPFLTTGRQSQVLKS